MMSEDKLTSYVVQCGHCGNSAPMGIIWTGKYTQIYGEHDPENNIIAPFTDFHWSILVCQLCNSPIVRQTAAFSELDIENYVTETLYPSNRKFRYLPTKVQRSTMQQ